MTRPVLAVAYPTADEALDCGCETDCTGACDDGYDESFFREIDRMDWPDGEVPG